MPLYAISRSQQHLNAFINAPQLQPGMRTVVTLIFSEGIRPCTRLELVEPPGRKQRTTVECFRKPIGASGSVYTSSAAINLRAIASWCIGTWLVPRRRLAVHVFDSSRS